MSVRDIAKLLGIKRWAVHAIAMECAGAYADERRRRHSIERETALEARRAETHARLFAMTGTIGGFYQRWKVRQKKKRGLG